MAKLEGYEALIDNDMRRWCVEKALEAKSSGKAPAAGVDPNADVATVAQGIYDFMQGRRPG